MPHTITAEQLPDILAPHVGARLVSRGPTDNYTSVDITVPGLQVCYVDIRELTDAGVRTYRSGLNESNVLAWDAIYAVRIATCDPRGNLLSAIDYRVAPAREMAA